MENKEIEVRSVLGMTCEQFQSELGKEEPADMESKEIGLRCGWTIEDAMNYIKGQRMGISIVPNSIPIH